MLIRSNGKEYSAVKKLLSSNINDVYICRQVSPKSKNLCTVNVIKDSSLISELLPTFMAIKTQNSIDDLVDLFSMDSNLYIVFNYYQGKTLCNPDVGILPLKEKIELAKNLLLFVKSSKLPFAILNLLLEKDKIIILNNSNNLSFNYFLNLNEFSSTPHTSNIIKKVGIILKEAIFHDYLLSHSQIDDIIKNCENQHYKSLEDLSHELDNVSADSNGESKVNSKKVLSHLKTTCFTAICIFLILFLILNINKKRKPQFNPKDTYSELNQIGTIELLPETIDANNHSLKR